MRKQLSHICFTNYFTILFYLGLLFAPSVLAAQISGKVFRDFNANGIFDNTATFKEVGVSGIIVTAYNTTGTSVGSATTNATGDYTIPSVSGDIRIEFSGLATSDYSGPKGSSSGTSIQFYSAATTTANFGINYPAHYCDVADPNIIVPCYIAGDPLVGGNAGEAGVLVSLPYSSSGYATSATYLAKAKDVGSVYGQALLRSTKKLFMGAFVKRHVGLGSGGAGAIYMLDLNTSAISLFTTLSAGSVPSAAIRNLPDGTTYTSHDSDVYDLIGKAGLGEIEISDDESTLYVVNLADKKLYAIGINNAANPTVGNITSVAIPSPCGSATARPFAIKYYRGKVYVGTVCTNEATPSDTTNLKATVFAYDGSTFTEVLSFPLTYAKGATNDGANVLKHWYPWSADFYAAPYGFNGNGSNPSYPQAWLTGIDFDVQGNMLIALRDRYGDQAGWNNYGTDTNDGTLYPAISNGDILKAGKCGAANTWTIESASTICNGTPTATGSNGEGIGGGEFFNDNVFCCHNESSMGSLAIFGGTDEVLNTSLDPRSLNSGGFRFFNNTDGTQNRNDGNNASGVELYSDANVLAFGKANGLGSLDLNCAAQALEIGNRVWADTNSNGIQDAGEAGIDGITVKLFEGATEVGSTTTANGGQYYFTNTNVTGGVKYNTAYEIRIGTAQAPLSTLSITTTDVGANGSDLIDNDGTTSGADVIKAFTTGSAGENNHSFDFGFYPFCDTTLTVSNTTICNGSMVNLFAQASGVKGTLTYSTDGTTWTVLTNPTNVTPSVSTTYFIKDTLTSGCFDIDTLTITVNQPVTAGVGTNPAAATCQAASGLANINLAGQITGATSGGTWSQTGGTTVGTALNTTTGVFNPNGIAVGTHTFRYTVTGTAPCLDATTDITITIQNCCPPTICIPVTVVKN